MQLRKYRRNTNIQFIAQDFRKRLPLPRNQLDLILALYTGDVSKSYNSHLTTVGFLFINNYKNDMIEASKDNELTLISIIKKRKDKYRLINKMPDEIYRIWKPFDSGIFKDC